MVRGNNNYTCSPSILAPPPDPHANNLRLPFLPPFETPFPSTETGELAHETLEAVRELFGQWEDGRSNAEKVDGVRVASCKCNSSASSLVHSSASSHLLTGRIFG